MRDWSDLKLLLAIARNGNLIKAAKSLSINHSTVFRKLNDLEQEMGVRLFERLPGGQYRLTPSGERSFAAAERMEDEAVGLMRDLAGQDHRLSGRLRVTSSETLAYRVLTRLIADFRKSHPGIAVELLVDNRVLSLSRHEADIALRAMRPKEGRLWGRKLIEAGWTIYGAQEYVDAKGMLSDIADLSSHPVIGWEPSVENIAVVDWLSKNVSQDSVVYRSTSLINQLIAVKNGIGLAALPCYLGDAEPGLRRAFANPLQELTREIWIVTHRDLKDTARIRAFFEIVGDGILAEKALFTGKKASARQ